MKGNAFLTHSKGVVSDHAKVIFLNRARSIFHLVELRRGALAVDPAGFPGAEGAF